MLTASSVPGMTSPLHRPLWTDELEAGLDTSVGEVRSLGQEPVARVDGVHIMLLVNKIRVKDVIISRC